MATKKATIKVTKTTGDKGYEELDKRLTALEQVVKTLASRRLKPRKEREYTDEERAAIRVRLLAGQEAASKRRENEVNAKAPEKTESSNTRRIKKVVKAAKPKNTTEPVVPSELSQL